MQSKRKINWSAKRKLALEDILTFRGTVRIPVSGSVPLADEVRRIIETPTFQRLRGVRQLGPTHFVYPGAVHTRFEHSLGTYSLSIKYVQSLLARKEFYQFPESPIEMAKLLIASALLHDIGHYPFSHLIEEIGSLPSIKLKDHEERAEQLILGAEIGTILKKYWKIKPKNVCMAIRWRGELRGGFAVMATALSSVLDLDKMDYLIRDSVHCGVNFGLALDTERFLAGLHIDKVNTRICLSTKAEAYIPTLITIRNLMYNEVYWHKTVRSCAAMMKTLIYRLCLAGAINSKELTKLFHSQDDRVAFYLYDLAKKLKNNQLMSLANPFIFDERCLYKMVFELGMSVADAKPRARSFLGPILDARKSPLYICLQKSKSLEKALRRLRPAIRQGDILIESTPVKSGHEKFDLQSMKLWNERTKEFVVPSYDIDTTDKLLDKSRRAFIFCHPLRSHFCQTLKNEEWEQIFYSAMKES